jgi:hypothetical protein
VGTGTLATRLPTRGVPPRSGAEAIRAGDAVVADDGELGRVAGIIHSEDLSPVYVVVRARKRLRRRYPVIPVSFVAGLDSAGRIVRMRGGRDALCRMPESLPLVI